MRAKFIQFLMLMPFLGMFFSTEAMATDIAKEADLIALEIKTSGKDVATHQLALKIKQDQIHTISVPATGTYEGKPLRYVISAQEIKPSDLPMIGVKLTQPIAIEIRLLSVSGKKEKEVMKFNLIGENGKEMQISTGKGKRFIQLDIHAEKLAI